MGLFLEVCLVAVIFSGTKMWSSKCPDHQAAGNKTLLSDHDNINSASEKRNKARNNVKRGYLKEEKKCLSTACFKTWLKPCIIEMVFHKMHFYDAMINT